MHAEEDEMASSRSGGRLQPATRCMLPKLVVLSHPCLRCDFPLPSSLRYLRVAVARPWEILDRLILLGTRGKLPVLEFVRLTELDEARPWVQPQQLSNLSRLQNLRLLILPPFKARPSKLVIEMREFLKLVIQMQQSSEDGGNDNTMPLFPKPTGPMVFHFLTTVFHFKWSTF